jgi:hypothetical protein
MEAVPLNGIQFNDGEAESDSKFSPLWGDFVHDPSALLPPIVVPLETLELLDTGTLICTWRTRQEHRK